MVGEKNRISLQLILTQQEWSEENVTENRQSSAKTPRDKKTSRTSNNKNNSNINNNNSKAPNVNNTWTRAYGFSSMQ